LKVKDSGRLFFVQNYAEPKMITVTPNSPYDWMKKRVTLEGEGANKVDPGKLGQRLWIRI